MKVKVITSVKEDALLLPKKAVIYEENEPIVFTIADGRAQKVKVETGLEDPEYFEATENLSPGDQIITIGQHGLKQRSEVQISVLDGVKVEPPKEEKMARKG